MMNDHEATSSCCSASAPTPAAASNNHENLLGGVGKDIATCPVMVGNPVSKKAAESTGLYRDYEGERYYLCCGGCGPAFDSNPAKYAANKA